MQRLGILLSGRGSNFMAIAEAIREGRLPGAEIAVVLSNLPDAAGLRRVEVQPEEISEFRFVPVAEALGLLSGPIRRRVRSAVGGRTCQYLEDGRPVAGVRN